MTSIFVAKLDFGVSEEELRSEFERYGSVSKVHVAKDKETGKPRGFAFVEMFNDDEAQQAIQNLDGHSFNGRNCVVKQAEDRASGNQQSRPPRQDRDFNRDDNRQDRGFNRGDNRQDRSFNRDNRGPSNFNRPNTGAPSNPRSEEPPVKKFDDDDDAPKSDFDLPGRTTPKKKVEPKKSVDTTADGKNKKTKMNAYKKSGKDNFDIDDEDIDENFDLFGRDEDEEIDEDYSKYLVNSDDDDYDDDDYDDDDYDDDEDY